MHRICFVCLGNICRSPMAQGVFADAASRVGLEDIAIDSAGTGGWHIGAPPDPRAIAAVAGRGIDIAHLRARQFVADDFNRFDIIAAMDASNLAELRSLGLPEHAGKVRLFLDFARDFPVREVPDPYYGGPEGFDRVLDLLEIASQGLIDHITRARS